ncbi:hypothetical protein SCALM49S_09221 [Streptomyces californicus]
MVRRGRTGIVQPGGLAACTLVFRGSPGLRQLLLWFNLARICPVLNIPFIYKDEMTDVMTPFMCAPCWGSP